MKNEVEVVGKTVEDAVNTALEELGTSIDKVNVDILCEGGMFKKAKVRVKLLLDRAEENAEIVNEIVNEHEEIDKETEEVDNKLAQDIKQAVVNGDYNTYVAKFLKDALNNYINDLDIQEREQNKVFVLQIKGQGSEKLGKTEVVNALQTLLNAIERHHNKENAKRIIVNVGDYEEKRKEMLFKEATKCADQAMSEGRTIRMQPMNSYERHLIHDFLQDRPEVIAESFGVEPYRYLTIRPNDKDNREQE